MTAPPGTSVLTVQATDNDSGNFGEVGIGVYSFLSSHCVNTECVLGPCSGPLPAGGLTQWPVQD